MSVIQSTQSELRYLNRKNLNEESNVIGNYYRDIIRSYGVDCIYYKLNTKDFTNFRSVIDQNTLLRHAYGYDDAPCYDISANMITFPEIQQDIFQLNKYGVNPQVEIDFAFDSVDFACALAPKFGQYKEYKIKEIDVFCEVPAIESGYIDLSQPLSVYETTNIQKISAQIEFPHSFIVNEPLISSITTSSEVEINGVLCTQISTEYFNTISTYISTILCSQLCTFWTTNTQTISVMPNTASDKLYLSSHTWPYELGLGMKQYYTCDMLSGKFKAAIPGYEIGKQYTIVCNPYEHTDFFVQMPANSDLYKSMKHTIESNEYLETLIFLTYKVSRIAVNGVDRFFLTGKIHGSILFFDINRIDKYIELIHPQVGDVIAIDFPDENNREKYEITECYNRLLTQDGISPLLHNYIWKCKARRFVESIGNTSELENEADRRAKEILDFQNITREEVASSISLYDTLSGNVKEDAAYGGMDGTMTTYDHQTTNHQTHTKYEFLDESTAMVIFEFGCGTKLVTTGYELLFIDVNGDAYQLTTNSKERPARHAYFESQLRFLKATDCQIVFINIEDESTCLACDDEANPDEIELCLNSLHEKTLDVGDINEKYDNFYKFKGTRSYLWSTEYNLYAKLSGTKQLIKLI